VTFTGNQAAFGGGVYCEEDGTLSVASATISANSASEDGGGMVCGLGSSVYMASCVIAGNSAGGTGGGLFTEAGGDFTNVTIAGNTAGTGPGGGVHMGPASTARFLNVIIWSNTGEAIHVAPGAAPDVDYSIVEGPEIFPGLENLNADPLFVPGGVRPRVGSPAIDAGTPAGAPATDIEGNDRPCGAGIDIGAYELCSAVLAADPAALDFGSVPIGSPVALTVAISNEGVEPLTVETVALAEGTSGEFAVTADPAPITLDPGAASVVEVTYSPADVGADDGALIITPADPERVPVTVVLAANGLENQDPFVPGDPFPPDGSSTDSVTVLLSWTGGDPDEGDTVTYDVYFGQTDTPPLVAENQEATTFDPGVLTAGVMYYWRIVAADSFGATAEGPLWQFLACDRDIELSAAELSFGSVTVGGTSSREVVISNAGCLGLDVTLAAPAAPFRVDGPLTYALGQGESATVSLIFEPLAAGDFSATVTVQSNDPDEASVDVTLAGTATPVPEPEIELTPASLDFGDVPLGAPPAVLAVTVANVGTNDLEITAIALGAGGSADYAIVTNPLR
jgi:predicted outer membrane repeat protein